MTHYEQARPSYHSTTASTDVPLKGIGAAWNFLQTDWGGGAGIYFISARAGFQMALGDPPS